MSLQLEIQQQLQRIEMQLGEAWRSELAAFDVNQLEHTLAEITAQRKLQKDGEFKMIHLDSKQQLMACFSPIVLSLLDKKVSYSSKRNAKLDELLEHYFNLDALALQHQQCLQEMKMCYELEHSLTTNESFLYKNILQCLLNEKIKYIIVLGRIAPELAELLKLCQIQFIENNFSEDFSHELNDVADIELKKLFWKRKTKQGIELSQQITAFNTQLLADLNLMKAHDLSTLIDDFMYGEHMFEKISVFGEFTETIYKNHLEKLKKKPSHA